MVNTNGSSSVLKQAKLKGWKSVNSEGQFEVWSSGDKLTNSSGKLYTVTAGKDNGNNWLEISSPAGNSQQVVGIERTVQTTAGTTYNLSLDLAARRGYSADYTCVNIYVDNQKIGTWAGASIGTALNWQNLALQFTGNGQRQTIKIISEGAKDGAMARTTMIDDIRLNELYPVNTGLSAISAALTDTDGSESVLLSIENLPPGAVLTDGKHQFIAGQGATTADATAWGLGNLSITPPKDFNASFSSTVRATAKEQLNGDQASNTATIKVTVLPVKDAPVAKEAGFTVQQNGSVTIDFAALISDADGDTLTLSLTNPLQGVLKKNSDGSYTYVANPGFTGADSFSYTVSDGLLSTTATVSLQVAGPVVNRSASITRYFKLNLMAVTPERGNDGKLFKNLKGLYSAINLQGVGFKARMVKSIVLTITEFKL